MLNRFAISFPFVFVLLFTGCSNTPLNLDIAKDNVIHYYESGKYDEEVRKIVEDAIDKFSDLLIDENSLFVFDVDETVLSNYSYVKKVSFGRCGEEEWNNWVSKAECGTVPHIKKLYDFLVKKNGKIVFLTGRSSKQYLSTEKNLKINGFNIFDTIITRSPNEMKLKAVDFKSGKRKELYDKGYKIKGNIGDQFSDLEGGYSEFVIKIPNYLYIVD